MKVPLTFELRSMHPRLPSVSSQIAVGVKRISPEGCVWDRMPVGRVIVPVSEYPHCPAMLPSEQKR